MAKSVLHKKSSIHRSEMLNAENNMRPLRTEGRNTGRLIESREDGKWGESQVGGGLSFFHSPFHHYSSFFTSPLSSHSLTDRILDVLSSFPHSYDVKPARGSVLSVLSVLSIDLLLSHSIQLNPCLLSLCQCLFGPSPLASSADFEFSHKKSWSAILRNRFERIAPRQGTLTTIRVLIN